MKKMSSSKLKQTYDWDMDSTILLINLYKENECLYNNSHKYYKNRDIRQTLMLKIANEIEEKMTKLCSVTDIRRKVNTLRSQYLVEKQKIIKSKSTGEEYTPTVYWFPLLHFLDPYSNADLSQFNLDPPNDVTTDLPVRSPEQEPPKPPMRRKRCPSVDNMSEANFSMVRTVSNMPSIPSNESADLHPHITAFCNFLKSELICISESGDEFVKRAKRKLQLALFEVWDEIERINDEIE